MRDKLRRLFPPLPDRTPRRWWIRVFAVNGVLLLVVFAAIQVIPVNRANPPVVREPVWDAPETRELAVRACYDCHSNETVWPWYARIAPVSWVLWYDVTEGRQALNFSDWDRHTAPPDPELPFPPKPLDERIEDEIRSGRMPPGTYRLGNPDARLTEAEQEALIEGLKRTVQANWRDE